VFAVLSLVLAGVGIWGVSAFVVSRRVPEMGIGMALGAAPRGVRRAVQGDALVPLGLGLVAGGLLALAFTRWIRSLLFEVRSFDPPTVMAAVATLALTSWLASDQPARRAARLDPLGTLRKE
jgi:ABC-type lipoprotein release transport system permease subunit